MSATPRNLQRLERILTMVPWLLQHQGASLDEVARRFGTSADAVADDLDVLGYCGVPGYGGGDLIEASVVADRVSVRMADYFRRPLRLSLREALTLLLAAKAFAGAGLTESAPLSRAVDKLERTLGTGDTELTGMQVAIDLRAAGHEHLTPLRSATEDGRIVRLVYRSASKAETTTRDVEPWALVGWSGSWYLQGWCRLAHGPRDFRLDRIQRVDVSDQPIGRRPQTPPRPPAYQPGPGDVAVVLDLQPPAWWVAEWAVVDDVSEQDDRRRVRLRTPHLEWVARLVLRLAGHARVVAPDELVNRVRALADTTLERYADHSG